MSDKHPKADGDVILDGLIAANDRLDRQIEALCRALPRGFFKRTERQMSMLRPGVLARLRNRLLSSLPELPVVTGHRQPSPDLVGRFRRPPLRA